MNTATFLLDQDGPLADYNVAAHAMCVEFGFELNIMGPEEQTDFYFTNHIADINKRLLAYAFTSAPGWYRELPVTPGAQEGVEKLLAAGHEVVVCTKPSHENATCRDEKFAWICEHFPMLKEHYTMARDKSLVIGDFLIDDAPSLDAIRKAVWTPMIFATAYNGVGTQWEPFFRFEW